jgi:hypothetical protein
MANVTTYVVETVMKTTNAPAAAGAIDKVGGAAERAAKGTDLLRSSLGLLGGGFLVTKGLGLAKQSLIGFNSEMETLLISLSSSLSLGMGKSFKDAQTDATGLLEVFKTMAAESPATTKDFVDMASQISGAVTAAGMGLKDLQEITKGGVVAAAALAGGRADMIALDIQQMLAGTVGLRDRYARQLLRGVGKTDYHAFNKLSGEKRADLVKQALTGPALQGAAKAYETSFAGVVSTFEDKFQMAMGRVGKPLFAEITKEVASWSTYLDQHEKSLQVIGDKLVDAFHAVKTAVQFVVTNRDLLMALATASLAVKGIRMGSDFFSGMRDGVKLASNATKGFADRLGAAAGVIGAFSAAGIAAIGYIEARADADLERTAKTAGDTSYFRDLAADIGGGQVYDARTAKALIRSAMEHGFVDRGGAMHGEVMYEKYDAAKDLPSLVSATETLKRAMEMFPNELRAAIVDWRIPPEIVSAMTSGMTDAVRLTQIDPKTHQAIYNEIGGPLERMAHLMELFTTRGDEIGKQQQKAEAERLKKAAKDKVKVDVKVEVAAKDPDRWLVKDLERARDSGRRAPTRARSGLRGGF